MRLGVLSRFSFFIQDWLMYADAVAAVNTLKVKEAKYHDAIDGGS